MTAALVLATILVWLGALAVTLRGLAVAAAACGVVALLGFGLPRTVLHSVPAAAAGLVLYTAVMLAWRPPGLRAAWSYVRALY